jgi:hypothetical protein
MPLGALLVALSIMVSPAAASPAPDNASSDAVTEENANADAPPVAPAARELFSPAALARQLSADQRNGLAPAPASDPKPPDKPVLSDGELREKYVWATLGVSGAIGATAQASLAQWYHYPKEWTGASGFGQRWASAYGETAIAETTKYAVAHAFHHDPSFTPCRCTEFGARLRYALRAPFTSRTRDGRRVWSPAIFAGLVAGQMVSRNVWYPPGYGLADGFKTTGTGLVSRVATSIWKEFRPRNFKPFKLDSYKP